MKRKHIALGVAFGFILVTFATVPFNQAFAQMQIEPMIRFDGGPLPPWAQATLRRDGLAGVVTAPIHTRVRGELFELGMPQGTNWKPGDVITNWIVNFNDPSACTAPCDLDDILAECAGGGPGITGLHFLTGHMTTRGTWSSSGSLTEGDLDNVLCGAALENAETAEIHLIVRSHGPTKTLTTDELLDALSTVNGGCANAVPPPPQGPNTCGDPQFAVFPAPAP